MPLREMIEVMSFVRWLKGSGKALLFGLELRVRAAEAGSSATTAKDVKRVMIGCMLQHVNS